MNQDVTHLSPSLCPPFRVLFLNPASVVARCQLEQIIFACMGPETGRQWGRCHWRRVPILPEKLFRQRPWTGAFARRSTGAALRLWSGEARCHMVWAATRLQPTKVPARPAHSTIVSLTHGGANLFRTVLGWSARAGVGMPANPLSVTPRTTPTLHSRSITRRSYLLLVGWAPRPGLI